MRRGFSLLEVVISLLIMGMSITGALDLFRWGQARYAALSHGWQGRQAYTTLHREVRTAILAGHPASLTVELLQKTLSSPVLRVAELSLRPFPPDATFARARLFEDRNRNLREDAGEGLPARTWIFRTRSADSRSGS